MEHLVNENRKLGEQIKLLQNRVKLYEKLFEMSLDVINAFSHFIPDVVDKFRDEIESVKADVE
tara:strand:- start:2271 stop:2459 length:189 start_codon:yes stop_codon:yes gene_type:complete